MIQSFKKMWLEALRSEDYVQGHGALRKSNACDKFCCLGVAVDVIDPDLWVLAGETKDGKQSWGIMHRYCYDEENYDSEPNEGELSQEFLETIGLSSYDASVLITMNDGVVHGAAKPGEAIRFVEGKEPQSFATISNWIEEKL